jgi:hypothetical protein
MSHYAKVIDNIVTQVIVAEEDVIFSGAFGDPNFWVKTSYNTRGGIHYQSDGITPSEDQSKALRKNFAGIGFVYDKEKDMFYEPKPFESWSLNENTGTWVAPVQYPNDGKAYYWVESHTNENNEIVPAQWKLYENQININNN